MTRVLPKTEGAVEAAPPSHRGFSLSNRTRERIAGYLFVFPDALGLLIFVGGPMLLSLSLGFFSVSGFGEYSFVGLDNYRRMIGDPLFWRSLRVTILYIVLLVPAAVCDRARPGSCWFSAIPASTASCARCCSSRRPSA